MHPNLAAEPSRDHVRGCRDRPGGEFAHARPALVDDEEREHVVARQYLRDALDMLGDRRRDVRPPLTRQLPSGA
jgi:hypothetical protein